MLSEKIRTTANALSSQLIAIRHHLHANPELSFEEYQTAAYIRQELRSYGIEQVESVAGTGTVALLYGKKTISDKCIALRADIDALPIKEENKVSYCSQNEGVMHACGHDVHTTCLLGAARILKTLENEWSGCIKLIFQQGEEKDPGGASLLVEAGVLENPRPSAIFGLHCDPDMSVGQVGFCAGAAMAACDEVYIDVYGRGGHAARPQQCIDTVLLAAQVITALQQVVSRRANPLSPSVLSFGKIYSEGGATNIIPDCVRIWGTFRSFDEAWRKEAHQIIRQIAEGVCLSMGGRSVVDIPQGYPSVYNNPDLTTKVAEITASYMGGVQIIPPRMGGEDFAFYSQLIPACFYRIGTAKTGATGLHTPTFDVEESAIGLYAGLISQIATQILLREG